MADATRIHVMIVDDHEAVRRALELFLAAYDDLQYVGEAGDGIEAIDLCATSNPDVILMDLQMPNMNGVAATKIIRQDYPEIKILGLTSFSGESMIKAAIQAGASDCLFKDASLDELAEAIRAAAGRGKQYSKQGNKQSNGKIRP